MRERSVRIKKKTAVLLGLALVCCQMGPWVPEQIKAFATGEGEQISIRTLEEFLNFGENCVSETYSKGKYVVLETDLNLQGTDFKPIPVFAGTFDGQGHGIVGLSVHSSGSDLGLFRYVQENAEVKNLNVQGTLAPDGSRENVGGIAGVNRGTIENCSFGGRITAQKALGGIAGRNTESGVIRDCESQAMLTGNLRTGGIAGINEGLIEDCVNKGEINGTDQRVTEDSVSQFTVGTAALEDSIRVERVNDAGGIAGLSTGRVKNCINHGVVGYPHTGYNLGGITGRQSGLVEGCVNYGAVRGRKDVGGIAGQFEPYLTVKYEKDMFDNLEDQMEELSDMGDSMSGLIESAGDTATENLDKIDDRLKKIREIGRFYKDLYRDGGDDFDREADDSLDQIQHKLDRLDLELADSETQSHLQSARETLARMKSLREEMKKGYDGDIEDGEALKEWLELRRQQMEQLDGYGEQLKEDLAYLAVHVPEGAVQGAENFQDDMEDLGIEANTLIDVIRFYKDKLKGDLDSMDQELTAQFDGLSGNVDTLTDSLKDSRNQIRDQKNQIKDQISEIRDTITGGVDRVKEDRDLFEDVSDLENQEPSQGMIVDCANEGKIQADFQAGGIAGIIGAEATLDPEQDFEAEEERTLNVTRNIKAIVTGCINRQQVEVKNDYVGGIVGKANLGALIGNQNYGDIISTDGNYAGGITGSSAYILRGNYSMCSVSGSSWLGGIAGWGRDVLGNYSMVSFENRDGERVGAVAGETDEEGIVEENYYVSQGLGAVDGITYEGEAEGLDYETFQALPRMPEEFGRLKVEFLVEDQVLRTVYCRYGEGIDESQIPLVPKKDGYYYVWEEKDLSEIKGNEKVRAIYRAWNTTIASSEDKKPILLAEADFYPGTSLVLKEKKKEELAALSVAGYRAAKGYTYTIIQPEGVDMPEHMRLHVLTDGRRKNEVIGLLSGGQVRVAESRRDGEYLVFESDGTGEILLLEPVRRGTVWLWPAGLAILFGAAWIVVRRRRKDSSAGHRDGAEVGKTEAGQEEAEDGRAEAGKPEDSLDKEGEEPEDGRDEEGGKETGMDPDEEGELSGKGAR